MMAHPPSFRDWTNPPTMSAPEHDALDEAIAADTTTQEGLSECLAGILRAHLIGLKSDRELLPSQLLKTTLEILASNAKPAAAEDPDVVNLRAWAGKK